MFPLTGIAVDAAGYVYLADGINDRIQKFNADGAFITRWGSRGTANGQFQLPLGITVDAFGNVYVADWGNHRIQKFDAEGAFIATWGSSGTGNGQFNNPLGVAADAAGNVYVVDQNNDRVQKFSATGTFLAKWGSTGAGDGQFLNSVGMVAFISPVGVAVGAAGNVYVIDYDQNTVQQFASSWDLTYAIAMLQILSGMTPVRDLHEEVDVNGDGRLGVAEAIYILQRIAGMR
jgi:DNA-binding beta-propeller fold protein YncE